MSDLRERFYAPDGSPIDELEFYRLWVARGEDMSKDSWWRRQTQVGDVEVSSVWTGINFSWEDEPLIWETMIFGGEQDGYQWRYPSREKALDHHEELVRLLKVGVAS